MSTQQLRIAAAKAGQTTFMPEKRCPKHPHSPRYVSSNQCKSCTYERVNRNDKNLRDMLYRARGDKA